MRWVTGLPKLLSLVAVSGALLVLRTVVAARPPAYPGEQAAVDTVIEAGGSGEVDEQGRIVEIRCRGRSFKAECLAAFRNLPQLRKLSLSETGVDDASLEALATLPQLTELDLSDTSITDAGLANLKGLKQLKSLKLNSTGITSAGLAAIRNATNLETLDLGHTLVGDAGLDHLAQMSRLKELSLGKFMFGALAQPVPVQLAARCGDDEKVDDKADDEPDDVITDRGLAKLSRHTGLRTLELFGTKITDEGLKHLAGLTRLESLGLSLTSIDGSGFGALGNLKRLRDLRLTETQVDGVGAAFIGALTKLERLELRSTVIDDAALGHFARLQRLTYLGLDETKVTNAGLPKLAQLTQLKTLQATETKIDEQGRDALKFILPECELVFTETPEPAIPQAEIDERNRLLALLFEGKRKEFEAGVKRHPETLSWTYTGSDLRGEGLRAYCAVSFAAMRDDRDLIRWLYDLGARPSRPGCRALTFARTPATIELLLDLGASVEPAEQGTDSPLFSVGTREFAELYLKRGADVRRVGANGRTPLHAAAESGPLEVVQVLVERGADIDARPQYMAANCFCGAFEAQRDTPLRTALEHERLDTAEWLIEHGAAYDLAPERQPELLFHCVAEWDVERLRLLLKNGCDPRRPYYGDFPLAACAVYHAGGDVCERLRVLLEAGVPVDERTPVAQPARSRNPFDENLSVDSRGWTALHFAAHFGRLDAAELLIERGADVRATSTDGLTPLDCLELPERVYSNPISESDFEAARPKVRALLQAAARKRP